jgi:branched-chain amino acid transport system permease protein
MSVKTVDPVTAEAHPSGGSLRVAILVAALIVIGAGVLSTQVADFYTIEWSSWVVYGMLALSLTWVWGQAGIFSFGQAAFFGIGGYVYGIASVNLITVTGETFSAVVIAVAMAALAAMVLGYFMFYGRVGDVYVAIITLATSLVLLTFMASTADPRYRIGEALLGGYNGMVGIPPLTYGLPGSSGTPLSMGAFFITVVTTAALLVLALAVLRQAPFGRIVAAVRENELRTQLLGYDVRLYKLLAFMLGGAVAGLAGAFYASWAMFINPEIFGLQQAALVVIWVLVGGRVSYFGAFLGALLVQCLSSSLGEAGGGATPIILGAVLIAVVLLLPAGLVPTLGQWLRHLVPGLGRRAPQLPMPSGAPDMLDRETQGISLAVDQISKAFGRVRAVNGVSLRFAPRGVHCLLGPNGAGKSTFFNLLVGRYKPSGGKVCLADTDITSTEPYERARMGLGIKLQIASLYPELMSFENMWLAAYATARNTADANQRAVNMLNWLGLLSRAHEPAGILAHGQQQWLEIGMVLVTGPAVILLDEPTAGMTREETARTAELIGQLGSHASVIVVEHDMEFVRQLDVPITVFHQGRIFAQGSLQDLQRNEEVLNIYLGREKDHVQA